MIGSVAALALGALVPASCDLKGLGTDFEQRQGVQCGWVSVPLRSNEPDGPTIRLWTARIRGTGATVDDPILYINGGPGIATVDAILPNLAESKGVALLRQGRDVILFDQRGSGRSEQALCPALGTTLNAIEASGLDPAREEARKRVEFGKCRAELEKAGIDLQAYTTAATVADMEALRTAFGVQRWNLAAISWSWFFTGCHWRQHSTKCP